MYRKLLILSILSFLLSFNKVDSTKYQDPNVAWKIGLIPSLGQVYNEQYIKAFLFLSAEVYSSYKINEYTNLNKIGNRNTYVWWLFGIYILSIIDAYVEAHLSTFPNINEIEKE